VTTGTLVDDIFDTPTEKLVWRRPRPMVWPTIAPKTKRDGESRERDVRDLSSTP
jgi:hypothetical protein